jgi:SOS response regulatory protein OraA/RecX
MKIRPKRAPLPAPPAPSLHVLEEAALSYLDKSSCSVAHMTKLLERRILTWGRRAERAGASEDEIARMSAAAREAAAAVIAKLVERRFLDDATFAKHRAEGLTRAGMSRRAVSAYLAQKGVDDAVARAVTPRDDATELKAAVTLLRKRRIGAFSRTPLEDLPEEEQDKERHRWLGVLARAGFSFGTAERALQMSRERADELLGGPNTLY